MSSFHAIPRGLKYHSHFPKLNNEICSDESLSIWCSGRWLETDGIKFSGFSDTLLQEYVVNLVGAASSREYRSGTMLLSFIAAGSRSHKGR
jgi:hypothetical protein